MGCWAWPPAGPGPTAQAGSRTSSVCGPCFLSMCVCGVLVAVFFLEGGESLFPFLVLPVWPSFSGPNKVTAFLICGFGQRRFPFLVHRSQTVSLLFPGTWSETGEDSARLHLGGPGGGGGGQKGNLFQKREYLSPPAPFASLPKFKGDLGRDAGGLPGALQATGTVWRLQFTQSSFERDGFKGNMGGRAE